MISKKTRWINLKKKRKITMKIKLSEIKEPESKRYHGDIKELAESIKKEGLLQPLVINQNNELICGRRRFEAISLLGWEEVPVYQINTKDDIDKFSKAIAENVMRLNLSWQEEVQAKEELDQLMRVKYGSATQGQRNDLTCSTGEQVWTIEKTAELLNQSKGHLSEDLHLAQALKEYPELEKPKTKSDAKKLLQKIKIEEQRQELAEKGKNIANNKKWNIALGDINTYQTAKKYDFIITDPPYPKEYLFLYDLLGRRSKEWLEEDGLLITMCGQSYLNEIIKIFDSHLNYYWTACYLTPGQPTPLRQKQVNTTWKPLLIYSKNNYKGKIFGDVFKSDVNDKNYHEWGQSVSGMYSIISQICLPGQTIFDPFIGAGTTGIAALKYGCLFDGIDISEKNINIAKSRLNDEAEI